MDGARRAAESGGFPCLSGRFRSLNRAPAALLCRRKNLHAGVRELWRRPRRAAAAGILIAWKGGADGGRVRKWQPISFGFHLSYHSTERLYDQVQARVYLARRVYADTEPARQDADQGIRIVPDARTASAVGF